MRPVLAVFVAMALIVGPVACSSDGTSGKAPSLADARSVLRAHATALHDRDREAFLAAVSSAPVSSEFRQAQADEFDNLTRVPLASWSYAIEAPVTARDLRAAATKRYGTPALILHVTVRYAIARADPVPTERTVYWTFIRRGGRTVVAGDGDVAAQSGLSWRGPWDYGHLQVVRGAHSLVLGHDTDEALLPTLAGEVDAAVPAVTAVWGTGWAQYVVAIVPATEAEYHANSGTGASTGDSVAALAVSDGRDPVHDTTIGRRLLIAPGQLQELSPLGRQIVLRHEVTHVAAADATTEASPAWVVEGFADYVGNLHSGQSVRTTAAELRAALRGAAPPAALPSGAQFGSSGSQAAQAYQGAWLACRLIAAKVGQAGLVRFYKDVGAQLKPPAEAVDSALRLVLHLSTQAFTTQWRAYLAAQLG